MGPMCPYCGSAKTVQYVPCAICKMPIAPDMLYCVHCKSAQDTDVLPFETCLAIGKEQLVRGQVDDVCAAYIGKSLFLGDSALLHTPHRTAVCVVTIAAELRKFGVTRLFLRAVLSVCGKFSLGDCWGRSNVKNKQRMAAQHFARLWDSYHQKSATEKRPFETISKKFFRVS